MKQDFRKNLDELRQQVISSLVEEVKKVGGNLTLAEVDEEEFYDCPVTITTDDYFFNCYYLNNLEVLDNGTLVINGYDAENGCSNDCIANFIPIEDLITLLEMVEIK